MHTKDFVKWKKQADVTRQTNLLNQHRVHLTKPLTRNHSSEHHLTQGVGMVSRMLQQAYIYGQCCFILFSEAEALLLPGGFDRADSF